MKKFHSIPTYYHKINLKSLIVYVCMNACSTFRNAKTTVSIEAFVRATQRPKPDVIAAELACSAKLRNRPVLKTGVKDLLRYL